MILPPDESSPDEALNPSDRRKWHRYALRQPTWVSLSVGMRSSRALVRDVSLGGICLGLADGMPAVGNQLRVNYGESPYFLGQPVWRTSDALGLQFLGTPTDIDNVLQCVNLLLGLGDPALEDLQLPVYN